MSLSTVMTGSGIKYRPPAPPLHGIHRWIISSARRCRNAGLSKEEATKRIYSFEPQCRRSFQHREVENAVDTVFDTTLEPKSASVSKLQWHPAETAALAAQSIDEVGADVSRVVSDWLQRSAA